MKQHITRITKSKFARNVAIVASGTAGAQAITMIFMPFITRIYGPEAFGLLGVFMALVAILTPIAALTYPTAIVLPKEDADAKGIAKLGFWLALTISSLTAIILFFIGDSLLKLIGSEAISPYIMLIPLAMFFAAMLQITQQWLIRKKQFKITAKIAVVQSLIINSAKTGFGWLNPTAAILIIIATLGAALHAFMMAIRIKRNEKAHANINNEYRAKTTNELASKHKDFPIYRAPQVFINAVSASSPIILLASFFGPAAAGYYAIAKMALNLPTALIGKAVVDVFYPRITEASHNNENLTNLIIKATTVLSLIGLLPFLIVIVLGPWLFSFVFGSEWSIAGDYARWLALWLFVSLAARPVIAAIPTLGIQRGFLIFEIIVLFIRFISIYIGLSVFNNDLYGIALLSISNMLVYAILIIWVVIESKSFQKKSRNKESNT